MAGVETPCKKKHRVLSDLVGTYGAAVVSRPLTGEELYGLWLLRRRVHLQRASAYALATHTGKLPLEWFDALCDWPEQAKVEYYRVNADRSEAAFMARQWRRG
jgi:hypothetical protein